MSGIITAIAALLFSLFYVFFPTESAHDDPALRNVQSEGDAVIVGGVTSIPLADSRREPKRQDDWIPPHKDTITAESYVIMDSRTGKILYSRDPNRVWPAASITKLMTAITSYDILEKKGISLYDEITLIGDDVAEGTAYVFDGEALLIRDVFRGMLVGSINSFAHTLARVTDISEEEFIDEMNDRARRYGLWRTHFDDVTGLSDKNIITAKEGAWLLKEALEFFIIKESLLLSSYSFETQNTKRTVQIVNTNKLLESGYRVEGGKTGYIAAAKYNFAVKVGNNLGDSVLIVVLGSDTEEARFSDTLELASWTFENYEWDTP